MSEPEKDDPVGEAEADAEQAKAAADKAASDPQADLNQLLDSLRAVESQLYSAEVVGQVQQLSDADKQAFVSARLQLTSAINQLDTAQLGDIEGKLEQNGAALEQGIQGLQKSLGDLNGATSWTAAINGVIGVVGQIIPLV